MSQKIRFAAGLHRRRIRRRSAPTLHLAERDDFVDTSLRELLYGLSTSIVNRMNMRVTELVAYHVRILLKKAIRMRRSRDRKTSRSSSAAGSMTEPKGGARDCRASM